MKQQIWNDMGFIDWFLGKRKHKKYRRAHYRIITPKFKGDYCVDYWKYKDRRFYYANQLSNYAEGRRVRYWKMVKLGYLADSDRYVPIFYHHRQRQR